MHASFARKLLAIVAIGTFAACSSDHVTGVRNGQSDQALLFGSLGGKPSLIACPSSETSTTTQVVSVLGGVVALDGTQISIPAGALLEQATVTVTIPASNYMEVDVSVEGSDHFVFELPVAITVNYGRCNRANIDRAPLSAWYIDSETKAMLEQMPSFDNKLLRTVTFTTGHLSGYALAN